MNIDITSKPVQITPTIRTQVEKSFEKLMKFDVPLINPHIIIDKAGDDLYIEAKLSIPGHELFAKAQHEDFYSAINKLTDKLKQQIIKHQGKRNASRTSAA